jgi:DNA-binding NarL/FixJ family response regulator
MDALKARPDTIIIDMHMNGLNALAPDRDGGKLHTSLLRQLPRPSMAVLREYVQTKYARDKVFANGWESFVPK